MWNRQENITPTTKVADTDDILESILNDLTDYVNSTGRFVGVGLSNDMVTLDTVQTLTAVKTFTQTIIGKIDACTLADDSTKAYNRTSTQNETYIKDLAKATKVDNAVHSDTSDLSADSTKAYGRTSTQNDTAIGVIAKATKVDNALSADTSSHSFDSSKLNGQIVTTSVTNTSDNIPSSLASVKTAYDKGVEALTETSGKISETTADSKYLPKVSGLVVLGAGDIDDDGTILTNLGITSVFKGGTGTYIIEFDNEAFDSGSMVTTVSVNGTATLDASTLFSVILKSDSDVIYIYIRSDSQFVDASFSFQTVAIPK